MNAYFVTCTGYEADEDGTVRVVHCTYDPATKGGNAPDGRKVKGTIHWVEASQAGKAEVLQTALLKSRLSMRSAQPARYSVHQQLPSCQM